MGGKPELVLDARALLGEGAIWDPRRGVLHWVDIDGFLVHTFDPRTGRDRAVPVGEHVGCLAPRTRGGLVVALRRGAASLWRVDPDWSLHRMVDGVTISNGLAWTRDATTLYYIDTPTP